MISSMEPKAGGPPQGIRNLLPELRKHGIEQEVACMDSPHAAYLKTESISIHTLGPAKSSWAYGKRLADWLETHLKDYDAVICHGLWQYPLLSVRREVERLRKEGNAPRFYVYPHGMLDPWFQKETSRRLKALRNEIYWRLFERKNLNSANAVLYTCEEECRLAGTTFAGYQAKEAVVGYGIPKPPAESTGMDRAFLDTCPDLPPGKPYLLFLSRIHPKKGVDLVIRAYAELAGRSSSTRDPSTLPDLVIAGPLDSAYAEEMRALAASLVPPVPGERPSSFGALPAIHFPGMLQGDAKWGALYGAEAFVLPSHQENFGIAVVEALACGTPCLISTKVNIWREIATNDGGLVDCDDDNGCRSLLVRWLSTAPEEKLAMRTSARRVYEDHFAVEPAAARLAGFLKDHERNI